MSSDSDLSRLKRWWRTLGTEQFLAVSAPTRGRFTPDELGEDAAEEAARAGLGEDTSFAGWHWQSHERAFGPDGSLIGPLLLHWGGDLHVVEEHLQAPPAGFFVNPGEAHTAFVLDRVPVLGPDGLADPQDPPSVRQLLARLDEPISRSTLPFWYPPLTDAEAAWLRARYAESPDLQAAAPFVLQLARRDTFGSAELSPLLESWESEHGSLTDWEPWREVLHNLLQVEHPQCWEVVDRIGPAAAPVLEDFPGAPSLERIARWGRSGDDFVLDAWLSLQLATGGDAFDAAMSIAQQLGAGHEAAPVQALIRHLGGWRTSPEELPQAALRVATEERLPLSLRRAAARDAAASIPFLREGLGEREDPTATELHERIERFEAARSELLSGTGPDLTQYAGGLAQAYDEFRDLTADSEQWLHDRLADPSTQLQGIAFCLEILVSQGRGSAADVDALAGRWRKELTKKYDTAHVEWRHPMVTLTVLAAELDHPLLDKLSEWWQRSATPRWATELTPLTMVADPDEESAQLLWRLLSVKRFAPGEWRSWLLMRGRLDDRRPVEIAADLLSARTGGEADRITTAMIATCVTRLPLWQHTFADSSPAWLDRALEVAEDTSLGATAREAAAQQAGRHRMFSHPDKVWPTQTKSQLHAYAERLAALDVHRPLDAARD